MTRLTKEEQITKKSYAKIAKTWTNSHSKRGYWHKEMQEFQQFLPKGRLLDVGAGGGRDARELIELGYDYLGIDVSGELLYEARKLNPGAEFKELSLYDLDFNEQFDGFWCAAVLLHIPRDRMSDALKAIKKSLKLGAIGFISLKEGSGERLLNRGGDDQRYFVYWNQSDFQAELEKQKFTVLKLGKKLLMDEPAWLTYIVRLN